MTELLHRFETVAVLVFLVSSMAATGLTLTPCALAAPLRDVHFVLLALALNFVLAPACAWLLTIIIPLEPGHAAGLMLGGAAGAPFLPRLLETARGDLASAAALMALLTAGTILFLPFALPLMIAGLNADPWSIARPLLMLVIVPLAAGMVVRNFAASFAAHVAPILSGIGNAALLLLFFLMVALNYRALLGVIGSGAILAALLFFTASLRSAGCSAARTASFSASLPPRETLVPRSPLPRTASTIPRSA